MAVGAGFALLFRVADITWSPAIFLGLGLVFSNTVFAAKALEEKGELGTYHDCLAIGILVLQDLVAVGMLIAVGSGALSFWTLLFLLSIPLRLPLKQALTWSGHRELLLLYGLLTCFGRSSCL